jgi:hypothetical protein
MLARPALVVEATTRSAGRVHSLKPLGGLTVMKATHRHSPRLSDTYEAPRAALERTYGHAKGAGHCFPVYAVYICNLVMIRYQRKATTCLKARRPQSHPVLAFRAEPDLLEWTDGQAAIEGISRSDVARRALIRDRQRQQEGTR